MSVRILRGDCRDVLPALPAGSVHCCVTSPPYFGLRSYLPEGHPDKRLEIGLEETPDAYVAKMVSVFREVRRVLRDDGTLWLNLGDSYAGSGKGSGAGGKPKDLIGIPWQVAFALRADGWWLRSHIIWHKPNPMPESVADRPTSSHESIFLLAKSAQYYFDADAVREPYSRNWFDRIASRTGGKSDKMRRIPLARKGKRNRDRNDGGQPQGNGRLEGRNIRDVWTVASQPFGDAHFAAFPPALIEPCIKAGCPEGGGTVLDPFGGAGTTGLVADRLKRNAILIELNPTYADMISRRINNDGGMFAVVSDA